MLTPAQAVDLIRETSTRLDAEDLPLGPALVGRVLGADVRAAVSLPPFSTSAMDGYAVRAAELGNGPLPIAFRVAAGDAPQELPEGFASGIATGAPLPPGADAVVPIEEAEEVDGGLVATAARQGAHIRRAGGDIEAGGLVAPAGTVLSPSIVAAIAASGVGAVRVSALPRVAVLATGSELTPPGEPLTPGRIYESNLASITALAARAGVEVTVHGVVPDDREATERMLGEAIAAADVVVSTGGVSVGPHDHVKPALAALGVEEVFWRVAHKPGKPLWFGRAPSGTLVFGLPGNPVSCLVTFELFVREALVAMTGAARRPRPVARLASPVRMIPSREHAVRCRLLPGADGMELHPDTAQDSHLIVHAAAADAIALVPTGDGEAAAGTLLEYLPL
jgi:molybdopterin molybdotransferase